MRRWIHARVPTLGVVAALVPVLAGCSQNPLILQGQLEKSREELVAQQRQGEQLQQRVNALDQDNQELRTLLAQSQQQTLAMKDQLAAIQDELSDVTAKLVKARQERDASENRARAMTASLQRQGGVTITPNRSLQSELPAISLPGIEVRRDGEVMRIVLPAERLFEGSSTRLRPGAAKLLAYVAGELGRVYPRQMIGVEGHCDAGTPSPHETSAAWAAAAYQVLASQTPLSPGQLFITGHGANHSIYSNASPGGQERNRRVELVVYPERMGA